MTIKVKPADNSANNQAVEHVTGSNCGSHKVGMDVLPKAIFPVSILPINPEANSTETSVVWTATPARVGDVLRFTTGANANVEAPIVSVDTNIVNLGVKLDSAPQVTDEFLHMRYITLTLTNDGSLVTSNGPMVFVRDGVPTQVEKDTVTPANTRPIPVELVSTTGVEATFNVTTGDLNIDTTHLGPNFDSMRVGDGTNLLGINASNEALVHDTDVLAELQTLNTVDYATGAKQDLILAEIQATNALDFATETTLQAISVAVAKESKQDSIITELQTLNATDFATEAKQDSIITELQAIKNKSVDTVEDYYKRDFSAFPLNTASGWENLRTLTASINKISITNNSGNELLIRNQTTNKSIIVGQGAAFTAPLLGAIADDIEIQALDANATSGIIYINFEG